MRLSKFILYHLKKQGYSQSELAQMTGYTRSFISNVITGKRDMPAEMAIALEAALEVPAMRFWIRAGWDKFEEIRTRDWMIEKGEQYGNNR